MLVQFREPRRAARRAGRASRRSRCATADGSVRLAINVIEDVTELKQVEQAQRFLAEASRVLADSLDYEATLAAIARLAVPGVADWCGVDLVGDSPARSSAWRSSTSTRRRSRWPQELAERYPAEPRTDRGRPPGARAPASRSSGPHIPDDADRRGRAGRGAPAADPGARHDLGDGRPDARARARARRDHVRERGVGQDASPRPTCGSPRTSRCAPATAVENARLYRARSTIAQTLQASLLPPMLPEVPGVDAAALYRAGGRGPRGRRRLLRPLRDQRGPLVRGHRRRLRQGRRGGGRDRAGALHDPRGGGAAALAGGDPALGQRGDAARGLDALLHGRDRPPRPLGRRRAPDRRGRRPPAADRGAGRRPRRGARRQRARCSGSSTTRSSTTSRPSSRPATPSCSTPTASPRPAAPHRVWTPEDLAEVVGRLRAGATAQQLVDHVAEAALSRPRPRRRATTSRCSRCGSSPASRRRRVAGRGPVLVVGTRPRRLSRLSRG